MANVLALVERLRRLAYDRSLAPDDALRRIRDEIGTYDGIYSDDDEGTSLSEGRLAALAAPSVVRESQE
jgi:hypothetical protein